MIGIFVVQTEDLLKEYLKELQEARKSSRDSAPNGNFDSSLFLAWKFLDLFNWHRSSHLYISKSPSGRINMQVC